VAPADERWNEALAFYAAYLSRLDDVDSTRLEFRAEYDNLVRQLVWNYKVTPNATEIALGPRSGSTLPI